MGHTVGAARDHADTYDDAVFGAILAAVGCACPPVVCEGWHGGLLHAATTSGLWRQFDTAGALRGEYYGRRKQMRSAAQSAATSP